MDWKFLFFSLQGRISRTWWWIGTLCVLFATYGLSILVLWLLGEDPTYYWNDKLPTPTNALIDAIAFVVTLRAALAVDIKRIHDRGRTAYLLVPLYLGSLALIMMDGMGINPFFFDVEATNFLLMPVFIYSLIFLLVVYAIWMIIELGLGKGTRGISKYGPDPLEAVTKPTDETI